MSDSSFDIVRMITSNLWMIPHGIIMFVGLLLALVTWPRHPTVSLLAALAFAGMLLNMIGGQFVTIMVLRSEFDLHNILPTVGIFRSCFGGLTLLLLITAVFIGRAPRPVEAYPAELKPQDWK